MDIDWCLGCETQLTRPSVHGGYCSSSCYFKTTNDSTAYRQHSVFDSSSSSSEDGDDDEEEQQARQPSTSIRPSRVERIKKWAASVPACAGHPHLLPPPPPPTSLAASLQNISRPALLRRHSALRPTPASTFVSKTRPVPSSPSSAPLTARSRPSPPPSLIVGSPSIASSFLAPPSKVLHRIRSWVKSEPSTPTTTAPAFEDEEAEPPKIVTLDDTASTSTLVGDTPIPEKVQEWTTVSPAASLSADELSRLVLSGRHRHRASRVKLSDMANEPHMAHVYL